MTQPMTPYSMYLLRNPFDFVRPTPSILDEMPAPDRLTIWGATKEILPTRAQMRFWYRVSCHIREWSARIHNGGSDNIAWVSDYRIGHRFRLMVGRADEPLALFRSRVEQAATGLQLAATYMLWLRDTYRLPEATRAHRQARLRSALLRGFGVVDRHAPRARGSARAEWMETGDDTVLRWLGAVNRAFAGGSAVDGGAWMLPSPS